MTIDPDPNPNPSNDQILDWFEDSFSYDPFSPDIFSDESWLIPSFGQDQIINNNNDNLQFTCFDGTAPAEPIILQHTESLDSSKKRKAARGDGEAVMEQRAPVRKSSVNKKVTSKIAGNHSENGGNKDGRWAEQLLNPCATAMAAGNFSRIQHLFYVLHELASVTGDANHRLAAHGLRALKCHLSSPESSSDGGGETTFAATNHKFFRDTLINFNDTSPWFRIPNSFANSSILQILGEQDCSNAKSLHILDIGVSHGVQWPTLLEELTRRPGGPPQLVRLTVITPTIDNEQLRSTPFMIAPPGYNFSKYLLGYAKWININLQINMLDNFPLQNLNSQNIESSKDEILIICAQFRLHNLSHHLPDDRSEFLKGLRSLDPKGVVLSENNADCSCCNCSDFATGFSRRVEYLWRFLDSTSAAYKGRENEERRMMEGEAAKALTNMGEMNECKEKWCQRMMSAGFVGEPFGDDAIDAARAWLKKHHESKWEMKVEEKDGCVCLWWKGQPVSFCSLWKTNQECK